MVATDHDRSLQLALLHQIVHGKPELRALSVAEPADAGGQTLKLDAFFRQIDPAAQDAILREHLEDQIISDHDIRRLARKRNPAEWSAPFAEQRTDVGGHESGKIVSVLYAALKSEGSDVIAIVEGHGPHLLQTQHALNVMSDRVERLLRVALRVALAQRFRFF